MKNDHYLKFQKLDVYLVARQLVQEVYALRIGDSNLRDQAQRAAQSCFLQLAEGLPNTGAGMRRKYFTESNNSLHEVVAACDLALALSLISGENADAIQSLGLRLRAMLRGLMNGGRAP